jgi:hypothetical protein
MIRNKKISMAVLAGAAAVCVGTSAQAALQLEFTRTNETFSNGNFDVIDVILTGMTAGAGSGATSVALSTSSAANAGGSQDNNVGPVTGDAGTSPADAEVLALSGIFSATGAGNVLGTPGFSGTTGAHTYQKYLVNQGDPQFSGSPAGFASSFVSLPSLQSSSLTGSAGSSATGAASIQGTATALTGTWFVTPAFTGAPGSVNNQGGIQPGTDASALGAPNGLVAEILVTKNAGFTFAGSYGDYGQGANAQSVAFSVAAAGGTTAPPPTTHNIVNLTSATQTGGNYGVQLTSGTGANQATFAPNAPVAGTINVTKVGANSYVPGFANGVSGATAGTGAIMDFTAISGFAAGDQEIYALKLLVGGTAPTTTQMNSIVADIGGQSATDGVSTVASLIGGPTGLAGQIAGLFPGYDLMLTVTSGTTTPFLGFDFSQETNVAGVVVTNIAAVPEPASAAVLLIGSASLLLGRRKRNALMA